jgi:hypothetical protein
MSGSDEIQELDLSLLETPALAASAPYLRLLADHLVERQSQQDEVILRGFQRDIVQSGFFEVPSPFSGKPVASGDSIVLPDRATFYRFPDAPGLLLGAANLGKGYPIVAIVLVDRSVLVHVGERLWGVTKQDVRDVKAILAGQEWQIPRRAAECFILTGDCNFAHHVWNHLGALTEVARLRRGWPPTPVFVTFQPLGPIAALIPDIAGWPVQHIEARIPGSLNVPGRVVVNIGGTRVTNTVRRSVLRLARERASPLARDVAARLRSSFPVIWVSVRTSNRTPRNQADFIVALCKRVLTTYADAAILIDGHSYPEDFDENDSYDRHYTSACVANDTAEANRIIEEVVASGLCGPSQAVINACGLNILSSIHLAARADFYVSHHGTVQHKIGWLTDVSGIVHSNPRNIAINPGPWVALQTEAAGFVRYFDLDLIRASEEGDIRQEQSEEVRSRLFDNYAFRDVGQSVDFAIAQLRSALGSRSRAMPEDPEAVTDVGPRAYEGKSFLPSRLAVWARALLRR